MSGFVTGTIPLGTRVLATDESHSKYQEQLGHRFLDKQGKSYVLVEVATAVTSPYTVAAGGKCLAFSGAGAGSREAFTVEEGAAGEDFAGVVPPSKAADGEWTGGLAVGDILYAQATGRAKVTDTVGSLAESSIVTMGANGGVIADATPAVDTTIGRIAAAAVGAGAAQDVDLLGLRF